RLSLIVSLSAVVFGGLIGVPFGAAVALIRFPGREAVIVILNALMGLPPVVVGLAIYLLLSRSGPLGSWGLLFTPQAMIVAQTVLIAPIIAALTRQTVEDLWSTPLPGACDGRANDLRGDPCARPSPICRSCSKT